MIYLLAFFVSSTWADNFSDCWYEVPEGETCDLDPDDGLCEPGKVCIFPTQKEIEYMDDIWGTGPSGVNDMRGLRLIYEEDKPNPWCPPGATDEHGAVWEMCWTEYPEGECGGPGTLVNEACFAQFAGVGCAKAPDVNNGELLDTVNIDWNMRWHNGPTADDWSPNYQPGKFWAGCTSATGGTGGTRRVNEIYFDFTELAKSRNSDRYMPKGFFDLLNYHKFIDLTKVTVIGWLEGLRNNDFEPIGFQMQEFHLNGNYLADNACFRTNKIWLHFMKLEVLDLSNNHCTSFKLLPGDGYGQNPFYSDNGDGWAKTIKKLDLSQNWLSLLDATSFTFWSVSDTIDIEAVYLADLEELDLSANYIGYHSAFEDYVVKGETIVHGTTTFKGLNKLHTINLANNKIKQLPKTVFTQEGNVLGSVEGSYIDLRANPLECLPDTPDGEPWSSDGKWLIDDTKKALSGCPETLILSPTGAPTEGTPAPTTKVPTASPVTERPTEEPSVSPTPATLRPTEEDDTEHPTAEPTDEATDEPTDTPTEEPTDDGSPTPEPTWHNIKTRSPSPAPVEKPKEDSSDMPSNDSNESAAAVLQFGLSLLVPAIVAIVY